MTTRSNPQPSTPSSKANQVSYKSQCCFVNVEGNRNLLHHKKNRCKAHSPGKPSTELPFGKKMGAPPKHRASSAEIHTDRPAPSIPPCRNELQTLW